MSARDVTLDSLLAERAWVRSLARGLVASESDVDDVEQETWLAALRAPPRGSTPRRAWLSAVVRNQARLLLRRTGRRARFEIAGARPEATPSAADAVAHADALRALVAELLALDEPYRGTLLLRYFEGLSPGEIAARSGEPAGTVKTRLRRGLELLRARLDDDRGRERSGALVLLLAGSAGRAKPPTAAFGGALVAAKTIVIAGAALVLVAGLAAWLLSTREPTQPASGTTSAAQVPPRASPPPRARTTERVEEPTPAEAEPAPVPPGRIAGRVTGDGDSPLAGVRVSCVLGDAVTKDDGTFAFDVKLATGIAPARTVLRAARAGFASADLDVPVPLPARVEIRLAPLRSVRGRIVASDGRPVAGAVVLASGQSAASRDDGTFEFPRSGTGVVAAVVIARGFRITGISLLPFAEQTTICLRDARPARLRVVDEAGSPVAAASVVLKGGGISAKWFPSIPPTDADGRIPDFGVEWTGRRTSHWLEALVSHDGFTPERVSLPEGSEPLDATIVLRRGVRVRLIVETDGARAAPGWIATLHPSDRKEGTEVRAAAGADGVAEMLASPGRTYVVTADVGVAPVTFVSRASVIVHEEWQCPPLGGDIRWRQPALVTITARCVDDYGDPAAGRIVVVRSAAPDTADMVRSRDDSETVADALRRGCAAAGVSDANGIVALAVEPGRCRVALEGGLDIAERAPVEIDVGGTGASVELRVARGAALRGVVVSATGEPYPGVDVFVHGSDAAHPQGIGRMQRTHADGSFDVRGLLPVPSSVSVGGYGGGLGAVVLQDVAVPGEGLRIVVPTCTIRGRILGATRTVFCVTCSYGGRPSWAADGARIEVATDLDGRFVLDGVPPGKLIVMASNETRAGSWEGRVDGDAEIEIQLK